MRNFEEFDPKKGDNAKSFQDPAKKSWVWIGLSILVLGMTPFWPIDGKIFGYPKWIIFALSMGFLTSIFIMAVIFLVWKDSGKHEN